jgi:putative transcriptional regulator
MTGPEILALRQRLGLTRAAFAARYQLPERTLQNYEQGRDTPPAGVLTLFTLIDREPEMIARILGTDVREYREPGTIARILED